MVILLDGLLMYSREAAHRQFQQSFRFPEYYGRNLDALYDSLCAIGHKTKVIFINRDAMLRAQDIYGTGILECFADAAEENPNIELRFY